MFKTSITIGARAVTRLSTVNVSHVVQPRFDAPVTVNVCRSSDHWRRANFLSRVHAAHRALDHRQQQRPFGILGAEVLVERVGDGGVFPFAVEDRLVRHVQQDGDRRFQHFGQRHIQLRVAGRC